MKSTICLGVAPWRAGSKSWRMPKKRMIWRSHEVTPLKRSQSWGFPADDWGYPQLAGWFMLWKIRAINGWWLGVSLFQETPMSSQCQLVSSIFRPKLKRWWYLLARRTEASQSNCWKKTTKQNWFQQTGINSNDGFSLINLKCQRHYQNNWFWNS